MFGQNSAVAEFLPPDMLPIVFAGFYSDRPTGTEILNPKFRPAESA